MQFPPFLHYWNRIIFRLKYQGMKIAILGAGFAGLTAALRLTEEGHEVTVFESESSVGGLAGGFKLPGWDWTLEKSYHHLFTNDTFSFNMAKKLGQNLIIQRPETNIMVSGNIMPLDSAKALLRFPYLNPIDRIRTGLVTAYLKATSSYKVFEGKAALAWVRKTMGKEATKLIWEPLFKGKFGDLSEEVALTWFWARIKKRTPSLAYPEEGFTSFAQKIAERIEKLGGKILLNNEVTSISSESSDISLQTKKGAYKFDKAIVTLPTPIFAKIASLPKSYTEKAFKIPRLSALNLVLVSKKPFLKDTYWLNITDTRFPFLVLAEHTNFMSPKHYGGQHILYIGNYLPHDHPYLKMSPHELLKIFDPFLKKINPQYERFAVAPYLFSQPFAQPVVTTEYPKLIPNFQTPLKNVYLANLDMVYPWDRGTNYAIELGEKIVKKIYET